MNTFGNDHSYAFSRIFGYRLSQTDTFATGGEHNAFNGPKTEK